MAERTGRYPTGLRNDGWERVRPLLPPASKRGCKPKVDMREMLNAVRYMVLGGGGWRMLPAKLGPLQKGDDIQELGVPSKGAALDDGTNHVPERPSVSGNHLTVAGLLRGGAGGCSTTLSIR